MRFIQSMTATCYTSVIRLLYNFILKCLNFNHSGLTSYIVKELLSLDHMSKQYYAKNQPFHWQNKCTKNLYYVETNIDNCTMSYKSCWTFQIKDYD